ncbi:MAG: hypothetical protein HRU72_07685 [Planctomycetia bacterium]|uniref:Uncharacterized protein n=1 Tax=Candidatus Brocadia sapporoensis TaxID=392547 RepID=A0A1V6M1I7_9BACT|nr:hypothetical protein [Candidatus Brocadia sapporoensis]MCC7239245.1 hypothetical protein [Candidatus Brocadia sp.]QOJ06432.1 MAG: hypothetical protein HRU72_07685 [Planctomycetia bacterium]TVL94878.1 MAG: hypothetical protein CV082_13095 [Candidatus Brocadia sp. BL1]MDG6006016.1 hypothetical protein [Candidatus Brocadia sp.]OQD46240.1 hypothetical protein BIY37_04295 [Candidatus Brocadia sapporoensis]
MGITTKKAETFQILHNSGKSMGEAYKLAESKGNSVIAPNNPEGKIKQHALTDPKLLKISKKVAKHDMDIAEQVLRSRDNDPEIQKL